MPEANQGTESTSESQEFTSADILNFDPFEPKVPSEPETDSGQEASPPAEPKEAAKPDVPPGETGEGPEAQEQPSRNPELEQQLAELRQIVASAKQPQPQQEQAKPEGEAAPKFNFTVPAPLMQAMQSEDPGERTQAFSLFASGIANAVWNAAQAELQATKQSLAQEMPRIMQAYNQAERHQQAIAQDFYSKYPQLNASPELRNFSMSVAQQMAQSIVASGKQFAWTEQFRDAVGQRVMQLIAMAQAQPQAKPNGGAKPRYAAGSGSRSSAPKASPVAQDIMDTFDEFK